MKHRQLSKKSRNLCKDRGSCQKYGLRASGPMGSPTSHYIQNTELGATGVTEKVCAHSFFKSKAKGSGKRISNLKTQTTCGQKMCRNQHIYNGKSEKLKLKNKRLPQL